MGCFLLNQLIVLDLFYSFLPDIGNYFDTRGMIIFNNIGEMDDILKTLNVDLYKSMLPYVKANLELAKNE